MIMVIKMMVVVGAGDDDFDSDGDDDVDYDDEAWDEGAYIAIARASVADDDNDDSRWC